MAEQKTTQTTENAGTTEKKAEAEDVQYVKYTGVASVRTISKDQWEQAGVSDQEYTAWTRDTGSKLPKDRFSDSALDVLKQNGDFLIEE